MESLASLGDDSAAPEEAPADKSDKKTSAASKVKESKKEPNEEKPKTSAPKASSKQESEKPPVATEKAQLKDEEPATAAQQQVTGISAAQQADVEAQAAAIYEKQ